MAHLIGARILAGLAILMVVSSPASAQHPLLLAKLQGWNDAAPVPSSAILNAEVMKASAVVQKRTGGCLPTTAVIDTVKPATAERYIFNGIIRGQVRNGWTLIVRHPNCGPELTRYQMIQAGDGSLTTIRVNRGTSYAHDSLIGDTLPLASVGAAAMLRRAGIKCETTAPGTLGVVRISQETPGLGPDIYGVRYVGSWTELWPITICDRVIELPVTFTADGDGGAYSNVHATEGEVQPLSSAAQ